MKLKHFTLVCKRKGCDVTTEMSAHVVPSEAWHEHDNLGRPEQHPMHVYQEQESDDE